METKRLVQERQAELDAEQLANNIRLEEENKRLVELQAENDRKKSEAKAYETEVLMNTYKNVDIEVLKALGYSISQENERLITITDNDQIFEVNLEEQTLYESGGKNLNYLESPPGATYRWCYRKGMDIIINTTTFRSTLFLMDSGYKMIDIPKLKVIVIY